MCLHDYRLVAPCAFTSTPQDGSCCILVGTSIPLVGPSAYTSIPLVDPGASSSIPLVDPCAYTSIPLEDLCASTNIPLEGSCCRVVHRPEQWRHLLQC